MEIFEASAQWASRPADEKFPSLRAMYEACKHYASLARQRVVEWSDLRVESVDNDINLVGKAGIPARLTHFAFGQLAAHIGAPAGYLRSLPGTLAAQNLNYGLKERGNDENGNKASILFHANGTTVARAFLTEAYSRVWNHEVLARLIDLSENVGLVPARQTFTWSGAPLPPESERPPALYASDHDMYAFVMSPEREIKDPTGASLFRGVIVSNSEVGAGKLRFLGFDFRDLCQNHIIWGAQDVAEVSFVHKGNIRDQWGDAIVKVRKYFDTPASITEAAYRETTRVIPGTTKDDVLDFIFSRRGKVAVSKGVLSAGYDATVVEQDGPPNTLWGLAQGMTRYSQTLAYADERTAVDKAAGKLLEMAF